MPLFVASSRTLPVLIHKQSEVFFLLTLLWLIILNEFESSEISVFEDDSAVNLKLQPGFQVF